MRDDNIRRLGCSCQCAQHRQGAPGGAQVRCGMYPVAVGRRQRDDTSLVTMALQRVHQLHREGLSPTPGVRRDDVQRPKRRGASAPHRAPRLADGRSPERSQARGCTNILGTSRQLRGWPRRPLTTEQACFQTSGPPWAVLSTCRFLRGTIRVLPQRVEPLQEAGRSTTVWFHESEFSHVVVATASPEGPACSWTASASV